MTQSLQDSIHEWQGHEGQTDATMLASQIEVLAEELKTANLIVYLKLARQRALTYEPGENVQASIQSQIEQRLGLA